MGLAPFFALRYINESQYLPEEGASGSALLVKERQNNLQFYQTRPHDSLKEFESHRLLAVRSIKNMEFNDEIYVDYVNAYNFVTRWNRLVNE